MLTFLIARPLFGIANLTKILLAAKVERPNVTTLELMLDFPGWQHASP